MTKTVEYILDLAAPNGYLAWYPLKEIAARTGAQLVVTPVFLEERPDGPKVVAFAAKRARGAMARFVMEERLEDPSDLRGFAAGGYAWRPEGSTADAPVFLRRAAVAA